MIFRRLTALRFDIFIIVLKSQFIEHFRHVVYHVRVGSFRSDPSGSDDRLSVSYRKVLTFRSF